MRGYTQFRFSGGGIRARAPSLEIPADRSVNENESFVIRRGRFIMSGDVSEHLSAVCAGRFQCLDRRRRLLAADARSLCGRDIFDAKGKAFRVRLGQSKVPYGWVNLQSSQNRAPARASRRAELRRRRRTRPAARLLMWAPAGGAATLSAIWSVWGSKGSGDYGVGGGRRLYSRTGPESLGSERRSRTRCARVVVSVQDWQAASSSSSACKATTANSSRRRRRITTGGATFTPTSPDETGTTRRARRRDGRAATRSRFGVEAEWTVGQRPRAESTTIAASIQASRSTAATCRLDYRKRNKASASLVSVRALAVLRRRPQVRPQRAARTT